MFTIDEATRRSFLALLRSPVSAALTVVSVGLFLAELGGADFSALRTGANVLTRPWQLVTSALLHVGVVHLAFNVYWVVKLGPVLERALGTTRMAALIGLLAVASSAAEHALWNGGVGLSGIGFGLVFFGTAARGTSPELEGAFTPEVTKLFVRWGLFCVALTVTGALAVANFAHAIGGLTGWVAGRAWTAVATRGALPWRVATVVLAVIPLTLCAESIRAIVNRGPGIAYERAAEGYATFAQDPSRAAELYEFAAARVPTEAGFWNGACLSRARLGEYDVALRACEEAARLAPGQPAHVSALAEIRAARDAASSPARAASGVER